LLVHRHNARGNRTEVVSFRRPRIYTFDPMQGPVGTDVQVTGESFTNATQVTFSPNVVAPVRILSPNTLIATVPAGAVTGPITVTNAGGSTSSSQVFTVTPPPEPSPSPVQSPGAYLQPDPYAQPESMVQPQPYLRPDVRSRDARQQQPRQSLSRPDGRDEN
jgi:hypothetical protein